MNYGHIALYTLIAVMVTMFGCIVWKDYESRMYSRDWFMQSLDKARGVRRSWNVVIELNILIVGGILLLLLIARM